MRLRIDARDLAAVALVGAREEVLGQAHDVGGRGAQAGHLDRDDVQPPEEIGAEAPVRDLALEVAVGRGQDAHVDLVRRLLADGVELAVLDEAQQLGLHAELHLADLVEEDRAAVGLREAAQRASSSRR